MKTLEELMALAANCEDAAHSLREAERADASADVIVALRSELWSDRERLRSALAEVVYSHGRLLSSLIDCVDDSRAAVEAHIQAYGESYRPERLSYMRKVVADADAAIDSARSAA